MTRFFTTLAASFTIGCSQQGPVADAEPERDAGLPRVVQALPSDALDAVEVGLDLHMRVTGCMDGVLVERGNVGAQTETLSVGARGRALVGGGVFTDGRWRPEDGFVQSAAHDLPLDRAVPDTWPHAWLVDATRLPSRSPGAYTFSIAYEHRVAEREGETHIAQGGRFEISLSEGQRMPLDALALADAGPTCPASATIDVTPRVGDRRTAQDERVLQYALWFVDTAPDGTQAWTHADFGGLHGERVAYRLPALRRAVEVGGTPRDLLVGSEGGLRGRWRDDGAIDLHVDAELWQSLVEPTASRRGEVGTTGQHAFRIEVGEVLQLDFETQDGRFRTVAADGTEHEASLETLRAGHQRALLVSVTAAQARG